MQHPSDAVTPLSIAGNARDGVGGHGLAGPVAAGVGRRGRGPAQEAFGVGHGPGHDGRPSAAWSRGPALAVAVEEAGQHGHAPLADGGERRDHGRDRHPCQRVPLRLELRGHLLERLARARRARPAWRRGAGCRARAHDAVGHPAAGHDLPVSSTANALTEVVPTSTPTVTGRPDGLMNLTRVS